MTILTTIALVGCVATLGLGGISMMADRGYRVDLRARKERRRGRRAGGRRAQDWA
jgi:hypothetical protein